MLVSEHQHRTACMANSTIDLAKLRSSNTASLRSLYGRCLPNRTSMSGGSGGRSPICGKDEDDAEDIGKLLEPRSSRCSARLLASCSPDAVAASHAALGLDGAPVRRHT